MTTGTRAGTEYIAKRASALVALGIGTAVVIASMASVLARLNAVNSAASALDSVLGTLSAIGVVGVILVPIGVILLGLVGYRAFTIVRL